MATFSRRQIRGMQAQRTLFVLLAVALTALTSAHLAAGTDIPGLMTALPATLFAAAALLANHCIGIMKRAVARDEFRERMAMVLSPVPPPAARAPRSAWDVSLTLNPATPWNDVVHYEDASRKPDGIANGVIRIIPRTAVRPWSLGAPVVTSWTAVTRAPSHGEGIDLLKVAEPLLRDELLNRYRPGTRYFHVVDGALFEVPDGPTCDAETGERLPVRLLPVAAKDIKVGGTSMKDMEPGFARLSAAISPCAHPDAEPVDLLVTGESVAWVCPECGTAGGVGRIGIGLPA